MDELRFYWKCLSKATASSWGVECIISTVVAYSAPVAATFLEIQDKESVRAVLLLFAPIFAIMFCCIVAPLRESFRMYRELEQISAGELAEAKARQKKAEEERDDLRSTIDSVETIADRSRSSNIPVSCENARKLPRGTSIDAPSDNSNAAMRS